MREIRPFYFVLVAFCLLVFQPVAHAQIWNQSSSAYAQCREHYDSLIAKGYPASAANKEMNNCMSSTLVQEAEARQVLDEAMHAQQQQANTTSSTTAKKTGGTRQTGTGKKTNPSNNSNTNSKAASEQENSGQASSSGSGQAKAQCEAHCSAPGYSCQADDRERKSYTCKLDPNASTGSSSQAPSNASVNECTQQYQALADECTKQTEEATSLCDAESNSGMSQVTQVANESTKLLSQATASSIATACGKAGELSAAASAALAGYAMYCNSGRQNCGDACSKASEFLKEKGEYCFNTSAYESGKVADKYEEKLSANVKSCSALASKAADAQQLISGLVSTLQNSTQCAALNSSTSSLCAANPRLPGCSNVATECTTTACICAKNPSDPACVGQAGSGNSSIIGGTDSSTRLTGQAVAAAGMDGDIPSYGIEQGKKPGGDAAPIDGKQGGGAGIGGGDSGGGGGRGVAGGGGSGDPSAVNSGFYGGGGGMGGWGTSSGGRAGGAYAGNAAGAAGKNGMPNLRSFLPGGKFDPRGVRGIAGATGPDGITGPHTDIWKKVNNRYQVMSPSLLP